MTTLNIPDVLVAELSEEQLARLGNWLFQSPNTARLRFIPAAKYLLFAWDDYKQQGGWFDFVGVFNTIEEAKQEHIRKLPVLHQAHIVNMDTRQIVCDFGNTKPYDKWKDFNAQTPGTEPHA